MINENVSSVGRFAMLDQRNYEIMNLLCNDDELSKLIYYSGSDSLSQPSLTNPTSLINTQIFPNNFVPDIQTQTNTIINVYFDNFVLDRHSLIFKNGQLKFTIWVNKSNNILDSGTRIYSIINRIDNLFNFKTGLGIGDLIFSGSTAIVPNLYYSGYTVVYNIRQVN